MTLKKSNNRYGLIRNFISEYPLVRLVFIFSLILAIIASLLDISIAIYFSRIIQSLLGEKGDKERIKNFLFLHMLCIVSFYFIMFIAFSASLYFSVRIYKVAVAYFMLRSLNIDQSSYNQMGQGDIRSLIDRKSLSLSRIVELIFFKIPFLFFTVVSIVVYTYIEFGFLVFLYSISLLLLFFLATNPLFSLRNRVRSIYNSFYTTNIGRVYRILQSYDIVKAYNKENEEIEGLEVTLQPIEKYGFFLLTINELQGLVSRAVIIIPNGFFFYFIMKYDYISSVQNCSQFVKYNTLFCTLKSKLGSLREELVKLRHHDVDLQMREFDDPGLDIQDIDRYYNLYKPEIQNNILGTIEMEGSSSGIQSRKNLINIEMGDKNTKYIDNTYKKIIKNNRDLKLIYDSLINHNSQEFMEEKVVCNFKRHIYFDKVSLKYNDHVLFSNASFYVNKGEKIALVGKNGTGKSSIINILLRYRDYIGNIYIDDVNMVDIYKPSQRNNISYIPQEAGLISGTVIDNLRYHDRNIKDEVVIETCKKFGLHDSFISLPDGYYTDVGENGESMSGGQRQKISFMRGVIKNAEIFILDEPTANLDPKSEKLIISNIFKNLNDKTVIVIVHNHSLLTKFDKIIGIYNKEINLYSNYNEFITNSYLY